LSPRWQQFHGGHPAPNEQSLAAARAAFHLLEKANQESALLIFLISGGGSAMMESPISDDISLHDLRTANKSLVACGASIAEINSVRRAFSAVKGGRLVAGAPNCDQITLIVSDVPRGEEANVASGPTLAPPNNAPSAGEVVAKYKLQSELPPSVMRAVKAAQLLALSPDDQKYFVLLDNESALQAAAAAARRQGFIPEIASEISDQPIAEGCRLLMKGLEARVSQTGTGGEPVCLISGGEFACPVQGSGIGGRNLETALRLACTTTLSLSHMVALCAGTDGIDGNSPAAGAIIDSTTPGRANAIGIDAEDFLRRSDSYSFFVATGDVLTTGVTGTNVRDVRILILNRAP
jgi:hydroxypyruvate reductase